MAVLIEAHSVVVSNAALDRRFPGGTRGFAESCPNSSYCSDGTLSAVAFASAEDAALFTNVLRTYGFSDPWRVSAEDIAVAIEDEGFVTRCDWLSIDRFALLDREDWATPVAVARLVGERPTTFSAPAHWLPSTGHQWLRADQLEQEYETVREDPVGENGARVIVYRHRRTEKLLYVPRTPNRIDPSTARLITLRNELTEVRALPPSRRRDERVTALYNEATRGPQPSDSSDWRWLQLQAQVAMLTGRWKAAEQALRQLTHAHPALLDGWLELTMVLAAKLDRIEEAEAAALQAVAVAPKSAAAYGNLSTVLSQQGKPEAAMQAIKRALELEPSNVINKKIHGRLLESMQEEATQPGTPDVDQDVDGSLAGAPWYKRLFRRS